MSIMGSKPSGGDPTAGLDGTVVVVAGGGLLGLGVLLYVLSLVAWFCGQITGLVFHGAWPDATPAMVIGHLPMHLTDPAQAWPKAARDDVGPVVALYFLFLLVLIPIGFGVFRLSQAALRFRRRREYRRFRLGFAHGGEVRKLLSSYAVSKKAKSVRPSYKGKKRINPLDVGYYLGKDVRSQRKLYCSVEDVMLVVAPPRQGKDVHFCVPNIIDAPGPCIATTTRADMFINTVSMREKVGKVFVFDPNGMTNWPSQMRWSPVNGCDDPLVALNRAAAFVSGAGVGEGVQNATYWTGVAIAIMRCYLLAAAVAGKTVTDVQRWSNQPTNPEPISILREAEARGRAPQGWAGELENNSAADPESRGSMWSGVRRALDCLADPGVLVACSPSPEEEFHVEEFVKGRNTLYVLGKEQKNGSVAPLVTAMMEDIFYQVRKIAGRMPNSRIDPPLTVELNEVAHIAPMPNLPGYMGDSGGFSIALHVYLQSLGQARGKWGNDEAAVMWDTAAIRIVMGGSGYVNDLDEISRLLGEVDEKQKSVSKGQGGRSVSFSKQKRRVMSIDELRTLEFGTALVIARAARPVEAKLLPYFKRKDAKQISAGQKRVGKMLIELEQKKFATASIGGSPSMSPPRDLWAEQKAAQAHGVGNAGGATGAPPGMWPPGADPYAGDGGGGNGGGGGGGAPGGFAPAGAGQQQPAAVAAFASNAMAGTAGHPGAPPSNASVSATGWGQGPISAPASPQPPAGPRPPVGYQDGPGQGYGSMPPVPGGDPAASYGGAYGAPPDQYGGPQQFGGYNGEYGAQVGHPPPVAPPPSAPPVQPPPAAEQQPPPPRIAAGWGPRPPADPNEQ